MIVDLLLFLVFGVLVAAALAPMESMSWWAGWNKDESAEEDEAHALPEAAPEKAAAAANAQLFLVYLSGIGAISGDSIPEEEYPFIKGIEEQIPSAVVVSDIYPYSVTNKGLTAQRPTAWLWRRLEKQRFANPNAFLAVIINVRNMLQMFVSADRRYGPMYNLGVSHEIWRGLLRNGYSRSDPKPIVMVGWSGGGQIAIGTASYLANIGAPLYVVSLGGMLSDDYGLLRIQHLWHLYGEKDNIQSKGQILFAGRWRILPQSPWNRALAEGKITMIPLGPFKHNGEGNYFDMKTQLPDGEVYGQKTIGTIVDVLAKEGLIPATPVAAQDAA